MKMSTSRSNNLRNTSYQQINVVKGVFNMFIFSCAT